MDAEIPSPIVLAFATNHAYLPYCGVTLYSALRATSQPIRAYICVDFDLLPADRAAFDALAIDDPTLDIRWIDTRPFRDQTLDSGGRWSPNTYDRLLLDQMLDEPRVIYLDADFLILADLAALWQSDLCGKALGVVPEFGPLVVASCRADMAAYYQDLGIKDLSGYFNAGVLVIDLDRCRQSGLLGRCHALCIERPQLRMNDQDALNMLADGDTRSLDYGWNVQPMEWFMRPARAISPARRAALLAGFAAPKAVHFSGRGKPWHPHRYMAFADRYYRLWRASPWGPSCPRFGPLKHMARLLHWLKSAVQFKLSRRRRYLAIGRIEIFGNNR